MLDAPKIDTRSLLLKSPKTCEKITVAMRIYAAEMMLVWRLRSTSKPFLKISLIGINCSGF